MIRLGIISANNEYQMSIEVVMIKLNSIAKFFILVLVTLILFNPFIIARDIELEPYTHTFTCYEPGAKNVSVVGTFNQWNEEKDIMIKNNSGYWEKSIMIDRFVKYGVVQRS